MSTALLENHKHFTHIYISAEKLQSHEFDLKFSTALERILNHEGLDQLGMKRKINYPKNLIKS